uniref:StAR related lipid transfer domain containing 13 n=1 Tax=Crocodylus porosus TaxID=8502 RepID=A0A7M4EE62_CROPO
MLKQVPRTSGSNCYHLNSMSPESQEMCLRFDQTPRRPPYRRSRILARHQLLTKIQQEIEAKETCDWLRAAGFPQYAHLYEDSQFPIDIAAVKTDHDFLDKDLVEPLCRYSLQNTVYNLGQKILKEGPNFSPKNHKI